MSTSYDFTTFRLGRLTSQGQIELCPKCRRKGAVRRYRVKGEQPPHGLTIHAGNEAGGFFHVTDRCFLNAADLQSEAQP